VAKDKQIDVLSAEALAHDSILFRRVYFDIAGDLASGLVLAQIVYWFSPAKDGRVRLRVQRNGRLWLVKRASDWWHEVRVKERTARRILQKLKSKGLLDVEVHKYAGTPQTYVWLNEVELGRQVATHLSTEEQAVVDDENVPIEPKNGSDLSKLAESTCPNWPNQLGQNEQIFNTETTTETTTETNDKQINCANSQKANIARYTPPSPQSFDLKTTPVPTSSLQPPIRGKDKDVDKGKKINATRRAKNDKNIKMALRDPSFTVSGVNNRPALLQCVSYFLDEFEACRQSTHPVLSKKQWVEYLCHLQRAEWKYLNVFRDLVDEFFGDTKRECDYHFPYFAKFQYRGESECA